MYIYIYIYMVRKRPINVLSFPPTIFASDGPCGLTCELRKVRYANYSPVYHSISSFDRTVEMACSTCDIQTTIKG